MTIIEAQLTAAGYLRSPNNIHSLPLSLGNSPIWYAGSPYICQPLLGTEIQVYADRIRLYKSQLFGEHNTRRCHLDTVTLAVFADTLEFLDWCQEHGQTRAPDPASLPKFSDLT